MTLYEFTKQFKNVTDAAEWLGIGYVSLYKYLNNQTKPSRNTVDTILIKTQGMVTGVLEEGDFFPASLRNNFKGERND